MCDNKPHCICTPPIGEFWLDRMLLEDKRGMNFLEAQEKLLNILEKNDEDR